MSKGHKENITNVKDHKENISNVKGHMEHRQEKRHSVT